jgi:hypothetical protein
LILLWIGLSLFEGFGLAAHRPLQLGTTDACWLIPIAALHPLDCGSGFFHLFSPALFRGPHRRPLSAFLLVGCLRQLWDFLSSIDWFDLATQSDPYFSALTRSILNLAPSAWPFAFPHVVDDQELWILPPS